MLAHILHELSCEVTMYVEGLGPFPGSQLSHTLAWHLSWFARQITHCETL